MKATLPVVRTFFALLFALSTTAAAQSFTSDRRLLQSEGILRGSPRLMGLAGTYVAIAEGAEGQTRNPAAVAHKDPRFENEVTVDFGGTMHFLFPGGSKTQDWDNDGLPDRDASSAGVESSQVAYSTVSVQYGAVGIGLGFDWQNFIGRYANELGDVEQGDAASISLLRLFGSIGVSLLNDAVLLGAGVESSHAFAWYLRDRKVDDERYYRGFGYQFGALFRPKDENYRIGLAFKPQTLAKPTANREFLGTGDQLRSFSEAVTPGRLSLGATYALGSGGRALNITSRAGLIDTGEVDESGLPVFSAAMTKWLFSAQLDVFLPVENAVTVSAYLGQQGTTVAALPAGNRVAFLPRIAVEKELWADRFRLRAGGYLEPAMVATGSVRPHVTFGGELYLFKAGPQRLSFGLSFDFAERYQNLSVAIVVWK